MKWQRNVRFTAQRELWKTTKSSRSDLSEYTLSKAKKRIWNPFWKPYPSFYVKRIFAIRFAIWLKCCISCIIGSISSIPHIRLAVFCYKKAEIRYFFAFLCTIIIIEMNHIPQNPGRTHDCLPLCRSGGLLRLNDSLQLEMPTYIYLAVFISSHYFRIRA